MHSIGRSWVESDHALAYNKGVHLLRVGSDHTSCGRYRYKASSPEETHFFVEIVDKSGLLGPPYSEKEPTHAPLVSKL
jgi:hypothetical protein